MAKILMHITVPGSMDGITANLYEKGKEYNIDDQQINQKLADIFLKAGWAELLRERTIPAPSERAVEVSAPEIKDHPKPAVLTEEETERKESFEEGKTEVKSTRVYELAGELGIPWAKIVKMAGKLGINVKVAQAGLTESEVKKIKANFKK